MIEAVVRQHAVEIVALPPAVFTAIEDPKPVSTIETRMVPIYDISTMEPR